MNIPFRLMPKGAEENVFKKVRDGWLFTTANQAYLRPRRTYLVTNAQKPAIAAQVRRSRYANMMIAMVEVPLIMAACTKFPWLLTLSLKAFLAWVAVVLLISTLATIIDHLMMRSVIKDLPRTTQKISWADMWRSQSKSMSAKTLAIFSAFATFCAVVDLVLAWSEGKVLVGLGGVFMAFLAVYFGAMLVAKRREKPSVNGC